MDATASDSSAQGWGIGLARWETESRWYEASVMRDLFGTWTVLRCWGGKGSNRHGQMTIVVESEAEGIAAIDAIDTARQRRKPPYRRVQ